MLTQLKSWTLVAGLACFVSVAAADDSEGVVRVNSTRQAPVGVVRISSQVPTTVIRGQSPQPVSQVCQNAGSDVVYEGAYCPDYAPYRDYQCCLLHGPVGDYCRMRCAMFRMDLADDCAEKRAWFRCKFGYFIPSGHDGRGVPPLGAYSMVYPLDPSYFDQRDGQVYAAQSYGGPVSVPLAPNVQHTYNYGWGIPSSRLTPVSQPIQ
jgi:hypothetical protein